MVVIIWNKNYNFNRLSIHRCTCYSWYNNILVDKLESGLSLLFVDLDTGDRWYHSVFSLCMQNYGEWLVIPEFSLDLIKDISFYLIPNTFLRHLQTFIVKNNILYDPRYKNSVYQFRSDKDIVTYAKLQFWDSGLNKLR